MAKKSKKALFASLSPLIDELGTVKEEISLLKKKEKKLEKRIKPVMIDKEWTLVEGETFKAERVPSTSTNVSLKAAAALLKKVGQLNRLGDVVTIGLTVIRDIAGKEAVAEIEEVKVDKTGKFKISLI